MTRERTRTRLLLRAVLVWLLTLSFPAMGAAQQAPPKITTPKQHFGFNMGDDYCLANYRQLVTYWTKLAKESDRVAIGDIGETDEGRPQYMAVVTSPANHKQLAQHRETSRRLAWAEDAEEATARMLAATGKAVVWIDGGLHASETLCAQALIESVYQFASGTDAETLRILNDVIILFVHANPDGMDLVADWYMREEDPKKRTLSGLPRLYQKYAGHDNNRDFYANALAESRNMNRVMYREWLPQIMLNQHQSGPPGSVLFCPPFRDPFNYNIDPLVINGIDAVGAAIMQRFLAEGKPGATTRSGATYSTWWNGGLRTTCYYHNIIGLLTETVGSPTPMKIPYRPEKQLPRADYLAPIEPQTWHFRQSVDYSISCNKAILDYASRNREHLLMNIWRMGRSAIEKGNRDSWTITPKRVEAAKAAKVQDEKAFQTFFRNPAHRDPRGYVISADQPDFLTAIKFLNILHGTGVTVHRARADFAVDGKKYPAGSFVVKAAQPFRAHVLDMFEPQDHPNDQAYPGGPPTAPYDIAGWTLAYQMGVQFDRILDGFNGPFEAITERVTPEPAQVIVALGTTGFLLDPRINDTFRAVNRLLAAGESVYRLTEPFKAGSRVFPPGSFYVVFGANTVANLEKHAGALGIPTVATVTKLGRSAIAVKPVRIALWDRPGGSMPSGWTRWVLDRFEFPYTVVRANELSREGLRERFDVVILPEGAISATSAPTPKNPPAKGGGKKPADPPASTRTMEANLRTFMEAGGTVLTFGSSTSLASQLKLPVENHLVARDSSGKDKPLGRETFYIPGSVLRVTLDTTSPLTWGLPAEVDVMFSASPTFRLPNAATAARPLNPVGWFATASPLRSGWAWGQEHLKGGVAITEATIGAGHLVLYGPQILFRSQPHGVYKLFFNGIYRNAAGK